MGMQELIADIWAVINARIGANDVNSVEAVVALEKVKAELYSQI